jgi:hypothetical protein
MPPCLTSPTLVLARGVLSLALVATRVMVTRASLLLALLRATAMKWSGSPQFKHPSFYHTRQ